MGIIGCRRPVLERGTIPRRSSGRTRDVCRWLLQQKSPCSYPGLLFDYLSRRTLRQRLRGLSAMAAICLMRSPLQFLILWNISCLWRLSPNLHTSHPM